MEDKKKNATEAGIIIASCGQISVFDKQETGISNGAAPTHRAVKLCLNSQTRSVSDHVAVSVCETNL